MSLLSWIGNLIMDLVAWLRNLWSKPTFNRYGWKKPHAGHWSRLDGAVKMFEADASNLPTIVDLRAKMPPVYDQGQLGSCTANASGGAVQYEQIKHGMANWPISRLFQYWNTRSLEGSTGYDSGGTIADAVKALAVWGFCPETMWPYNISRFTRRAPASCYRYARGNEIPTVGYAKVAQNATAMKAALAAGNPIIVGFTVFESFESQAVAAGGMVPMPNTATEQVLGGHAVLIVGYNDATQRWIVRNSWGAGWGDKGYFYMPYQYFTDPNLADDFWVVTTLKGAKK